VTAQCLLLATTPEYHYLVNWAGGGFRRMGFDVDTVIIMQNTILGTYM
jgi:hypothetical protein